MSKNQQDPFLIASTVIFIVFFLAIVPLCAYGFLYIMEIQLPFWKVFLSFILCTVVVKWFSVMWRGAPRQ
jgi:hypothetical protein